MSEPPKQLGSLIAIPPLILLLVPVLFYAGGVFQHITDRWTGMHDWNGAFYSQLAHNLIRYPIAIESHGATTLRTIIPPQLAIHGSCVRRDQRRYVAAGIRRSRRTFRRAGESSNFF